VKGGVRKDLESVMPKGKVCWQTYRGGGGKPEERQIRAVSRVKINKRGDFGQCEERVCSEKGTGERGPHCWIGGDRGSGVRNNTMLWAQAQRRDNKERPVLGRTKEESTGGGEKGSLGIRSEGSKKASESRAGVNRAPAKKGTPREKP